MKLKLFLVFIYLYTVSGFSQQVTIDSLKTVLQTAYNKSLRLKILKELCEKSSEINALEETQIYYDELLKIAHDTKDEESLVYGYQLLLKEFEKKRDSVKALEYFHKAHKINIRNKDYLKLAKDYNGLGGLYNKFQQYKKAKENYLKALEICENHKLTYIMKVYINLAIVLSNQNDFYKSTDYATRANELATKYQDIEFQAKSIGIIAGNYTWLENYNKSEEYYKKAIEISEKNNLPIEIINNYRGLALNSSRQGKFEIALKYHFKALELLEKYGDEIYILDVYSNIATTYYRMKDRSNAINYYKKGSDLATKLNSRLGLNTINVNMANLLREKGDYDKAELLLLDVVKDSSNREVLSPAAERSTYILLSMIYEAKNNLPQALSYHKKYFQLAYDIVTKNQAKNVAEIDVKYQTEKKENENLSLKRQNAEQALLTEREKTQKWAIGGGLVVSLAALGIFFIAFRKNQKQKKEIEQQKDLVEKLQRELHHRLKNNLSFIDFFITLAKGKFPDPAYRAKLDELQNRINSMFEVHKQLFKKEDVTSVNAKTYISALVENVKRAYAVPNITLVENVDDTDLRADTSFPIGLIVNEFVTNSYKYAFPNNKKGKIYIKLDEQKDQYLLHLSDNGKGLPEDFNIDDLNSFGMETIKLLAQEYKGTFKLDGTKGTRMDITFPKSAA